MSSDAVPRAAHHVRARARCRPMIALDALVAAVSMDSGRGPLGRLARKWSHQIADVPRDARAAAGCARARHSAGRTGPRETGPAGLRLQLAWFGDDAHVRLDGVRGRSMGCYSPSCSRAQALLRLHRMSPISSERAFASACWKRPSVARLARVNAPFSWPTARFRSARAEWPPC